jgi:hypothetical protein
MQKLLASHFFFALSNPFHGTSQHSTLLWKPFELTFETHVQNYRSHQKLNLPETWFDRTQTENDMVWHTYNKTNSGTGNCIKKTLYQFGRERTNTYPSTTNYDVYSPTWGDGKLMLLQVQWRPWLFMISIDPVQVSMFGRGPSLSFYCPPACPRMFNYPLLPPCCWLLG